MKRIIQLLILTTSLFLTTCTPPISTSDITIYVPMKCKLVPSQSIPVSLDGETPSDATVEWEVNRGTIIKKSSTTAEFTAPDQPGDVLITVKVTANGKTISKTETCSIVLNSTDTPELQINAGATQSSSVQSSEIPVELTVTPSYDFTNSCISAYWREWPVYQAPIQNNQEEICKDLSSKGMIATNEGLKIFVKQPKDDVVYGITTKIPESNALIAIQMRIDELSTNQFDAATDFYLGLVDSSQNILNGKVLIFRAYKSDFLPALIYKELIESGQDKQIKSTIDFSKDISIVIEKDKLSVNFIITGISGTPIEITDIPYDSKWDSLILGYKIPAGSTFSGLITDIQVSSDN